MLSSDNGDLEVPFPAGAEQTDALIFDIDGDGTNDFVIVDRAVAEYATRHADVIEKGLDRAREVLAGGDVAIAAHLLGEPAEAVARVAGSGRR